MSPLTASALSDRGLRHRAFRVYTYLTSQLDQTAWRPLKHDAIARALRLHRSNVVSDLQLLIARGYLECGDDDGRLRTYRLR
jgi:DNA-binding IclR family transcriptional regulator